jgi:hypothetical protein
LSVSHRATVAVDPTARWRKLMQNEPVGRFAASLRRRRETLRDQHAAQHKTQRQRAMPVIFTILHPQGSVIRPQRRRVMSSISRRTL